MVLFISCIALYTNIIAVSCNNDAGVISRDVDNNNRLLLRHRSLRMSDYNDPKTTEIRTKESSSLSPITSTSVQSKDINSIPTKLQRPKTKLSLALPQAEDKHCMFVISKLYGNHSQTRVDMTLNWYRSITVESINAAARFSDNDDSYVGILLSAEDSYADEAAQSLKQRNITSHQPDMHINTTTVLNEEVIPSLLQEHSCNVATMIRVDADDMLHPTIFDTIQHKWKDIKWNSTNSSVSDHKHGGGGAMVIGNSLWTSIILSPPGKGGINCLTAERRKTFFSSTGLSVTVPVSVLNKIRNKFLVYSRHTVLANRTSTYMKRMGLQTVIIDHSPLGIISMTPVSGHYLDIYQSADSPLRKCSQNYLISELGNDLGRVVWNARYAIPRLTNAEWRQNVFVKTNTNDPSFTDQREQVSWDFLSAHLSYQRLTSLSLTRSLSSPPILFYLLMCMKNRYCQALL